VTLPVSMIVEISGLTLRYGNAADSWPILSVPRWELQLE